MIVIVDLEPAETHPLRRAVLRDGTRSDELEFDGDEIVSLASELRWQVGPRFHQALMETIYTEAARIADPSVNASDFFDFTRGGLQRTVTGAGIDTVVIVGVSTSGCVRASATDAMSRAWSGVRTPKPTATGRSVWVLMRFTASAASGEDAISFIAALRASSTAGSSRTLIGKVPRSWWMANIPRTVPGVATAP